MLRFSLPLARLSRACMPPSSPSLSPVVRGLAGGASSRSLPSSVGLIITVAGCAGSVRRPRARRASPMSAEAPSLAQAPRTLSKIVLSLYAACWLHALAVSYSLFSNMHDAALSLGGLRSGLAQMCSLYLFECLLALWPGCCTMNPAGRWSASELFMHHAPFILTVFLAFCLLEENQLSYWIVPLAGSLLTALNEASLIGVSLGAPTWVAKARRAYGFGIVLLLSSAELVGCGRAIGPAWASLTGEMDLAPLLISALVMCAYAYHVHLLSRYMSSWLRW